MDETQREPSTFLAVGELLLRLEQFYDALPRDVSRTEHFGPMVLFIRNGAGWPFYARPRPGADRDPSAAELNEIRQRQRELGLPETFEWIHDLRPGLLAVARSAGLTVLQAPLLVLDPAALPAPTPGPRIRLLDPDSPGFVDDVVTSRAVAAVGFAAAGTAVGAAGAAQRDTARVELTAEELAEEADRIRTGQRISALVESPDDGVLASGMAMRVGDVAEIAGVATLPAARRRGLGGALTAALACELLTARTEVIFLSAGSEEIARVYLRVGFRRLGTACIAEPTATT